MSQFPSSLRSKPGFTAQVSKLAAFKVTHCAATSRSILSPVVAWSDGPLFQPVPAYFPYSTLLAAGITGQAGITAMEYQPVVGLVDQFTWNMLYKGFFDGQRCSG